MPVELKIATRRLTFLNKIANSRDNLICQLLDKNRSELKDVIVKYNLSLSLLNQNLNTGICTVDWKSHLFEYFEASITRV